MPRIEIDGSFVEVEAGTTIIEAAKALDIYIPHFCYHPKLSVAANCRMCLVEVEKVAKPLPACATPVADGMRVFTKSGKSKQAQKGVMEFLLINHPLDCPICDQGGECDLQDLAVGFGGSHSRYAELKRVVKDKDIGPLIETEMTRCIHCTRCVRFGQEIGGIMELGATGRGEHMEIGTYIERSLTSELIGNVIDLCPVGALTSKPFRYTARPWELKHGPSICPECSTGCNLEVDSRGAKVMRTLPMDNEAVNESWICDKGRFSYAGLDSEDRLTRPMVKHHGEWRAVSWEEALSAAAEGLRQAVVKHGPEQLGTLVSPRATTEELFLFQAIARGLGTANIDHRLSQRDFRADAQAPLFPALNVSLEDLQVESMIFLVGANPRKQQPITNLRIRKAALAGGKVVALNGRRYDFNYPAFQLTPAQVGGELQLLAQVLQQLDPGALDELPGFSGFQPDPASAERVQAVTEALKGVASPLMLLGTDVAMHPQAAEMTWMATRIARITGARLGYLAEFGNSAGAWLTGCVPHRLPGGKKVSGPGMNAHEMLSLPLKAYLLMDVEPGLDAWDGRKARMALSGADFVVGLSTFGGELMDYADVLLPVTSFLETSGTLINNEGRVQNLRANVKPAGETRPGWKVLRVLGNLLGVSGLDINDVAEVGTIWRGMIGEIPRQVTGGLPEIHADGGAEPMQAGLRRIGSWPIYRTDPLVRRSRPLTLAQGELYVEMSPIQFQSLGLAGKETVQLSRDGYTVSLPLRLNKDIPEGCIFVPAGYEETLGLGPLAGTVEVSS